MAAPARTRATAVELWLVVQPARGEAREVAVEAADDACIADLVAALGDHLGTGGSAPLGLFCRRTQSWLSGDATLAACGLRSGDALVIGATGDTSDWGPEASRHLRLDLVELLVEGGPAAGVRHGLPFGEHLVGREGPRAIDDPSLSRTHLRVRVDEHGVSVADAGSRNGTSVEGVLLAEGQERRVGDGEVVEAGRSLITFRRGEVVGGPSLSGSVVVQDGGRIPFNRPPRIERPLEPETVSLEPPPTEPQRLRLPLGASMLPLLVGIAMWRLTHNPATLLFTALTPLMAGWTFVEDRRSGKSSFKRDLVGFRERLSEAEERLRRAHEQERAGRREAAPDAVDLVTRAAEYRSDLWERRPSDDDFLSLRVGTGTLPARSSIIVDQRGSEPLLEEARQMAERYATLASVPVVVRLPEVGAIGLSGGAERVEALARWLVAQVAALHSPHEVVLAAAVGERSVSRWAWLKWLPHTHSESSPLGRTHLACRREDVTQLLETVRDLVRERVNEAQARFGPGTSGPAIVLVLDERVGPERALLAEVLGAGPPVGVYAIWLGARARDIPGECGAVVELASEAAKMRLTRAATGERLDDVTADGLSDEVARELALALAPVRDTSASRGRGQVPRRVTLLELLGVEPKAEAVADLWGRQRDDRLGVIGASADGFLAVDLRLDGPHALVAGTTGAGKSELLQTLVAGLALEHPPTRVTFLFVDYKGGAAFKECVELPHAVGFVTDLDEHLTRRALVSLNAELKRRETVLRDANARDLAELETRDSDAAPPSLVIVIDEFATLAREVPEFVAGVVDVAQRGRSLGVHLILATQRPGGVVSDSIRANTNLRIALRVNEPAESSDVVDSDEAARVARGLPGRGYIRTGHGELAEFQTAYVGGVSDASASPQRVIVRELSFEARSATQERLAPAVGDDRPTDLRRIVGACRAAAVDLRLPKPARPWLPSLPEALPLDALPTGADGRAVIGLLDEPALQQQRPYELDFDRAGSVLVFGASGSGKTTLLETLTVSLAEAAPPELLHVYGLDFASRALSAVEVLPHCGGVIAGDDTERVTRLFSTLRKETARRKKAFAAAGVFTVADYRRRTGEPMPRIVVLLDGYAAFTSAFERFAFGELVELVPRLVADGRPLGIHFVITADRRGAVPGALGGIIPQKVVLRMADADDYASLGLDARSLRGAHVPPGRGFVEATLEFQCGVVGHDPASEQRAEALAALAERIRAADAAEAPRIGVLPQTVPRATLPANSRLLTAIFGIGDEELEPVTADLTETHFLVTGPFRSGRSTALATLAASLADCGEVELALLAPRRSTLPGLDIWAETAVTPEDCEVLAAELLERIATRTAADRPLVVVVDDGEQLSDGAAAQALESIVRRGRDTGVRVLAAADVQAASRAFSGWLRELRRDEHGLLLSPHPETDGEIFGVRLPRRTVAPLPGRAYLVRRGAAELVQVALD